MKWVRPASPRPFRVRLRKSGRWRWSFLWAVAASAMLGVVVGCDSHVCGGPDCGPGNPPGPGEPQGPVWDTDGDSISNATEVHPPNSIYGFRVDSVDVNPSRAGGTPMAGWIDSAINLPDEGTMFVHHWGTDPQQSDDWGILTLLNVIQGAGRRFAQLRGLPESCRFYTDFASVPRIQVGDLSLQAGGQFGVCNGGGHCSHQNGTDVDVRYLRTDGHEQPLNLDSPDSVNYDVYQTMDVLYCFMLDPRVELIYYDSLLTGILNPEGSQILTHRAGHADHFHVRVRGY
jgi:hypothetical protein